MFIESWQLTLLYLITAPIIAVLVSLTTKRFRIISKRIQIAMGDITHVTQEGIESYQEIKIYGGQDYERDKFAQVNNQNRQQTMKMEVTKALSIPIIQLLAGFGLALVLHFALARVLEGTLTTGGFVTMVMYMLLCVKTFKISCLCQRHLAKEE